MQKRQGKKVTELNTFQDGTMDNIFLINVDLIKMFRILL